MSFIILLTARTDCLPTLRLCSNARACARVHLVLMLECSWPCSRAHVRARLQFVVVFECCRARACARVLVVRRAYDDESHETQAYVISRILNVVNVVRHYLVKERYFPDTNLRDMRLLLVFSTIRYNLHDL